MHTSPDNVSRPYFTDPPSTYASRDVLDFGIDTTFDFSDVDFGLPLLQPITEVEKAPCIGNVQNAEQPPHSGTRTPDVRNSISLGMQAFKKSLWQLYHRRKIMAMQNS